MSVRRQIEKAAFGGRRTLKRGPYPHIQVLASGDADSTQKGVFTYSVATRVAFVAINTAGTGTKIGTAAAA